MIKTSKSSQVSGRRRLNPISILTAFFLASSLATPCSTPHRGCAIAATDTLSIRINQVGYGTFQSKSAIVLSRELEPARFSVIDAMTGQAQFDGAAKSISGYWGAFTRLAELDFSQLQKPGRYYIQLGEVRSPKFEIREDVYTDLPDQLLEFMRQQRCGYNAFFGGVCHQLDGRTAYGPLQAGSFVNATGGWHDAGDTLKYLLTSSNATAQMLLAYLLGQDAGSASDRSRRSRKTNFQDRFNDLGQQVANGIPDILDEAKWGLDWMLKLHPAPNQLYHQVGDDRDHQSWRLPQDDNADYGWGPHGPRVVYFANGKPQGLREYKSDSNGVANLAGRYAAAMALGYQVWRSDRRLHAYARRLLQAGKEVYLLGKSKKGVQQGNSYGAPYRYEETTWADDMEWAAVELYRATKNRRYLRDAVRYSSKAGAESWMGRTEAKHYQYYPFMNLGHVRLYDLVGRALQKKLADYYREGIERCLEASTKNPFETGVPFIWCSNNLVVALATQCELYYKMTGDSRYAEFASKQRDWLLGRNPWGVSMFTEIPASGFYPRDVHLAGNAVLKRAVRGGLVDGPVKLSIFERLKGVSITQPDPLAEFQDERAVYHHDIKDYSTNEPTMDGTASAILLLVLCSRN